MMEWIRYDFLDFVFCCSILLRLCQKSCLILSLTFSIWLDRSVGVSFIFIFFAGGSIDLVGWKLPHNM